MEMFGQNFTVTNCMAICCERQHNIKFKDGRAVIPVWELFKIEKCWENNITNLCGIVCENDSMYNLHKKLDAFKFFTENIKDRNINKDIVVTKILIRDNCKHPYCIGAWCFEIFETKWVGTDMVESKSNKIFIIFLF